MGVIEKKGSVFWSVRVVLTRAVVVYAVLFLLAQSVVDHQKISFGLKMRIIGKLMPASFEHLVTLSNSPEQVDQKQIARYLQFYEHIVAYFPDRTDAFTMLGFCYYHQGRVDQAIAMYQKAQALQPDYFWTHYNLGVIFLKQGNYPEAVEALTKAVQCDSKVAISFIHASKVVYRGVLISSPLFERDMVRRLIIGYRNAYLLLVVSEYNLKNFAGMSQTAERALTANVGAQEVFLYFAGLAAYAQKDFGRAVTLLQSSLQRRPEMPDTHVLLGLAVRGLGDITQADALIARGKMLAANGAAGVPSVDRVTLQVF